MDFKSQKEQQIIAWFEHKENFSQFKDISKEDQEGVMSRLLSETFTKEVCEIENKGYPAQTLVVGGQAYKVFGCQVKFNSILDQAI